MLSQDCGAMVLVMSLMSESSCVGTVFLGAAWLAVLGALLAHGDDPPIELVTDAG
jgi:hypothetical protein